jgi:outer membrane protein
MKPYVGAGINYTHFFDETGGGLNNAKYEDSFGWALQAGVDVPLSGNWYANLDVKKIFLDTKVKFSPSGATANVDIDPWLVGVGVGYKF